jgi:hypothetical protein
VFGCHAVSEKHKTRKWEGRERRERESERVCTVLEDGVLVRLPRLDVCPVKACSALQDEQ